MEPKFYNHDGIALLCELEKRYQNGSNGDNLTDAFTDLLHTGCTEADLNRAVRLAAMHYAEESKDGL